MIRIMVTIILVLVINIGFLVPKAAAQSDKCPKMAPVDQYLMERNAWIVLARSAAPDSISSDATVLILVRQGYETAVRGKNGFVCMVERSWMAQFDSPEFWNPKIRGAECLNRQAARSLLPLAELRTRMVMAGHSKAEIVCRGPIHDCRRAREAIQIAVHQSLRTLEFDQHRPGLLS
jgi:hypothetical protein